MNTAPKVSIIIPVYNAEKTLDACAASVLSQTLADIEVIFVDDGSTDGSGRLCGRYTTDPRVKVLRQTNAGPSAARNAGIEAANGMYIAFADADDTVDPGMYGILFAAAEKTGADLAFCDYLFFRGGSGRMIRADCGGNKTYERAEIEAQLLPRFFGPSAGELKAERGESIFAFAGESSYCWLGLYRAAILKEHKISFLDQHTYYQEDHLFNLAVILAAARVTHVSQALYFYRDGADSLTKRFAPHYLDAKCSRYRRLDRLIERHGLGDRCRLRLQNRICLESAGILNYYVNSRFLNTREKYNQIRRVLSAPEIAAALAHAQSRSFPAARALYLLLQKARCTPLLFILSRAHGLLKK